MWSFHTLDPKLIALKNSNSACFRRVDEQESAIWDSAALADFGIQWGHWKSWKGTNWIVSFKSTRTRSCKSSWRRQVRGIILNTIQNEHVKKHKKNSHSTRERERESRERELCTNETLLESSRMWWLPGTLIGYGTVKQRDKTTKNETKVLYTMLFVMNR